MVRSGISTTNRNFGFPHPNLETMKRYAGFAKIVPLFALILLAVLILRPQDYEAVATVSRTYTSPALPSAFADGFDFPVGGGTARGYYTARRMIPYRHMGDDWNGIGGGNTDYGDPVLAIAHGKVVYSQNYGSDWGEVIIIRHKYRDQSGQTRYVDSLYGHVIRRQVSLGQNVRRGQRIASIGNNRGMYLAHLHLEIRKNTNIGIRAWAYPKSTANYHQPTTFINTHRPGRIPVPRPNITIAKNKSSETGSKPLAGLFAMLQPPLNATSASRSTKSTKSTTAPPKPAKRRVRPSRMGGSERSTILMGRIFKGGGEKGEESAVKETKVRTTIKNNAPAPTTGRTEKKEAVAKKSPAEQNGLRTLIGTLATAEDSDGREKPRQHSRARIQHTRATSRPRPASAKPSAADSKQQSDERKRIFRRIFDS